MMKKVVASLVLTGSLAIGSAGIAGAAPGPNCTKAPAVIARLQAEEAHVASLLATLQAKAAGAGHEAWRQRRSIALLTRAEADLVSQVSNLQTRCPSAGGGVTIIS